MRAEIKNNFNKIMNITMELQRLDDLIIEHTRPPVTTILRNKLHPLREQLEAYVSEKEHAVEIHAQRAKKVEELEAANLKLQTEMARRDSDDAQGYYSVMDS
jgi:hypothetical protein